MPSLGQLALCVLLWRPGASPRVAHVGFVVNKVILGYVLLWALWLSSVSIVLPVLYAHYFMSRMVHNVSSSEGELNKYTRSNRK